MSSHIWCIECLPKPMTEGEIKEMMPPTSMKKVRRRAKERRNPNWIGRKQSPREAALNIVGSWVHKHKIQLTESETEDLIHSFATCIGLFIKRGVVRLDPPPPA
jgi:hypothetical protein